MNVHQTKQSNDRRGRTVRLTEQRWVRNPLDETFRYAADFSNISMWDPGVEASTKRTEGAVGVGTKYDLLVKFGSGTLPMTYEVTEYEPPNRVVLFGSGEKLSAIDVIEFSRADNMTVIDYTADLTFFGAVRYLGPLMDRPLRRVGEKALDGLVSTLDK